MYPKVSFVIPTYNASKHLPKCLGSIVKQNYPKDKIEIIVADGGSRDNTREIARRFNTKIISNPKKLAEYGVQLGVLEASGDLIVIFAADNELVSDSWIQMVANIFIENPDVSAVWGRLVSGKNDPSLNKYFELIQSDPLNWFINKNLGKHRAKARAKSKHRIVFNVDPTMPLVWGANGLVYRADKIKQIWAQEGYLGDNDAFQYMIEQGNNKVAYFDAPFVYHHHVTRLTDFTAKWERNFKQHLLDNLGTRNVRWVLVKNFRMKLCSWIVYSLLPIFSFLHSIGNTIKSKNIYWLYHAPVCFLQTITYAKVAIFNGKWKQVLALVRTPS